MANVGSCSVVPARLGDGGQHDGQLHEGVGTALGQRDHPGLGNAKRLSSDPARKFAWHSPFHRLAFVEEASGGAVVGERGEPDRRVGTLVDASLCVRAAHLGANPAR